MTPKTGVGLRCYPRQRDLLVQAGSDGVRQEGRVVQAGLQLLGSRGQGSVEPIHGVGYDVERAGGGEDVAEDRQERHVAVRGPEASL